MRQKVKHGMLMAVVLIGLVIVVSPFFQHNNAFSTRVAAVKLPPFPDQPSAIPVAHFSNQPIDTTTNAKLQPQKNIAWAIQIGGFQDKPHALHLVNQLRANGYPAFIQKITNATGEHTRVFVGPANQRAMARELANRLQNDLHIYGMIVTYQPLTL